MRTPTWSFMGQRPKRFHRARNRVLHNSRLRRPRVRSLLLSMCTYNPTTMHGMALRVRYSLNSFADSPHFPSRQYKHSQYYWKPKYQSWIIRILLMVPIYAIGSCLSFRFFWLAPYIDIVRDCYEAFVVYSFFVLLQNYFAGSFEEQVRRLKGKPRQRVLAPFCCLWINPSGQTFLVTVRLLCLQYVVLRWVVLVVVGTRDISCA